jgi:small subunit ribosomal protein S18
VGHGQGRATEPCGRRRGLGRVQHPGRGPHRVGAGEKEGGSKLPKKPTRKPAKTTRKKGEEEAWQKKQRRKVCVFCRDRIDYVDYKDVQMLRRFVSDRGKIRARRVTGTCSQHQRDVAMAVKNAREMALLPYTAR